MNQRNFGNLFHYAHFITDCLYPEIIQDFYKYKGVIREKSIDQTIGNFHTIYTEVMDIKNIEIDKGVFCTLINPTIVLKKKEDLTDIKYINKFRDFIFL